MKTFVLSMISIAATVAAMTACTSESDEINGVVEAPEEIKMSAAVLDIATKSDGPIDGLASKITNVNFISQESTSGQDGTIVWTGDKISTHTANIETSGTITFDEGTKPYYSSDPLKYTYLIGYHPNSGILSNGSVTFNITGKEDIMYAGVVNGNKDTNKATDVNARVLKPEFKHLLAQLKIKVQGNTAAATAWGKIKSIKVQTAKTELKLDVKTGLLSEGTAEDNIDLIRDVATDVVIPATAESFGYSMVLPRKAQYSLIIATDNVSERIVPVTIPEDKTATPARDENETKAGEAYTITLTFSASEISAEAKVDGWKDVQGGSGTVD